MAGPYSTVQIITTKKNNIQGIQKWKLKYETIKMDQPIIKTTHHKSKQIMKNTPKMKQFHSMHCLHGNSV